MFQLVVIDDHEIMSVVSSGTIASMVSCNMFKFVPGRILTISSSKKARGLTGLMECLDLL